MAKYRYTYEPVLCHSACNTQHLFPYLQFYEWYYLWRLLTIV